MKLPTLSLAVSSSVWLLAYLLIVHSLLLLALIVCLQSSMLAWLLLLPLLLSAGHCLWRYRLQEGFFAIERIEYRQPLWLLGFRQGSCIARLQTATVLPWLVVMVFRCQHTQRRYDLLLFSDSVGRDQFRRLRVMLKHLPVYDGPA